MSYDIWAAIIVGATTLCVVDMSCFVWLRSNAGRREPVKANGTSAAARPHQLRDAFTRRDAGGLL